MRTALLRLAISALTLFGITQSVASYAREQRGITPEDYFAFAAISDPHISPEGKTAAYVLSTIDQLKNRRESSIWLVLTDASSVPVKYSAEGSNCKFPRWSADGKTLAYLSVSDPDSAGADKGKSQIYLSHPGGTELGKILTNFKNGVQSFQWSPDGSQIVAVSSSSPDDAIAAADRKSDVRHYRHIIYKSNDNGWDDGKRQHLWLVNASTGEARQITDGQDWNDTDPQWSPDGKHIAFVSDRTGKAYDDSHNTDVWVITALGQSLTKISDHPFEDVSPRWSPDGKKILFTGKTSVHQFPKLYLADSSGGSHSELALENLDLIPNELQWTPAGILFQSLSRGEAHIFKGNPSTRTFRNVTSGPRRVQFFDGSASAGNMVYIADDFKHLDDLYAADLNGGHETQLTHLNQRLFSQLDLQSVERLRYQSTDGLPIDGFFVKPLGWQPNKKYPMVLVIHGGPRDMFGMDWYHEFQVYAAKGWAVFFCNPRGSIGYGEEFERAQINNWGVLDYQDVISGVDAALKQYPWVDTTNLGVTGGSYGGYMTNWIVSHTNRFKAAVTLRSLSNFISDEGTRQGPYGHADYFKDILFDDFEQYWNASPLKYARNVRTPTLILHSEMDFQLPFEQAEQWFRALQHYGVPSEFVLFPRENHNITRTGEPRHLVESLNWQLYWFDRYLNGNANAKPPDAP